MNQTERLLQNIIENARMGRDACDQLLEKAKGENVRREMKDQYRQYAAAADQAEKRLEQMGVDPQQKGPMARMGMWMGMQMNTMTDRSESHIADLLIQGCGMGIVEITKAINSLPEADAEAVGIARGLITVQQNAIERLKPLLGQGEKTAR